VASSFTASLNPDQGCEHRQRRCSPSLPSPPIYTVILPSMALVRHGHEFGPNNLLLDFAGEDHDLLALLASFALEDVEDIQAAQKGKGKGKANAPPSDAELALRLYAEEAEALATFAKDAAFARSFDSALAADAPALASHMREELQAQYDHDVAVAIFQGRPPPPPPAAIASNASLGRLA
jgi:hypothetical protein